MFYPRFILTQLESELTTREAVVITGMRQVGKTTMLTHLFNLLSSQNKALLDLGNPLHRKVFEENNFDAVWNNLARFGITKERPAYIFLDEAQNLPQINQVIKYLYDHWQTKFFLTGSSSFYLKNLFSESLAGRKMVFEMFPLTFGEFLIFKGKEQKSPTDFQVKSEKKNKIAYGQLFPLYQEYLEFGGFPTVALEENPDRKRKLLEEIFTSYFEIDVKTLADFREISKLRDLILLLIPRLGSKVEIGKLASELSLSRETVYNYLSFLEQTYFIHLLPKFSKSFDRQAAGSKKLFLCDTGLAGVLGRVSQGQLFEQSIFQSLRPKHELCFYSKEGKNEIDFIVDQKVALEVKTTVAKRDLSHLKMRAKGIGLAENYLISWNYSENPSVILAVDI